MEQVLLVDCGLSRPAARLTLLIGWGLLLLGAIVGGVVPPVSHWNIGIWLSTTAIVFNFWICTSRRPGRLRNSQVALVILVTSMAIVWIIGMGGSDFGESAPYAFGYFNLGVSLLILRGHPVIGVLASVMVLVSLLLLGALQGVDVAQQVSRLTQPLVTTVGFLILHTLVDSIAGRRSRSVELQLEAVSQVDASRTRNRGSQSVRAQVRSLAEPILTRITDGELLTAEFHAEIANTNDEVREILRRDIPFHPDFQRAVGAARMSGTTVRILGNEDLPNELMSDALVQRLTSLITAEEVDSVTVRFAARSRGGSTSVVVQHGESTTRHLLDPKGRALADPS